MEEKTPKEYISTSMDHICTKTSGIFFPDDFVLGTATSAFQIEGEGKTEWQGFVGNDGTLLKKAINEGIPVKGYFHWSTFDNFELATGPSRKFGLVGIDFKDSGLERKIKESGHYFHKIAAPNSLIEPA